MKLVVIDLDDTYTPFNVAGDLSFMIFNCPLKSGRSIFLKIIIKPLENVLLPNVYNLSFGPPSDNDEIDDAAKIHHQDVSKVFSTILLFALTFLNTNKHVTIGLDGSNDGRAYLYHRIFGTNREYLNELFVPLGVDWYVRLLRTGFVELDVEGRPFFKPKPELFDYGRPAKDLYRYYLFHLASNKGILKAF
jgi:hypothetical protein